jgi:hypothetical protein
VVEASKQHLMHPFDRCQHVRLAHAPPEKAPVTPHLAAKSSARMSADPQYYHKEILRKAGFVLDLEAASSFASKLDVMYSWGRPGYDMTQFVHRTGTVLAQICSKDSGTDFLVLKNRLATNKSTTGGKHVEHKSAIEVIDGFRKFCSDEKALKALYVETHQPKGPLPSPFTSAIQAWRDADVPPIQLPPHLLHRVVQQ